MARHPGRQARRAPARGPSIRSLRARWPVAHWPLRVPRRFDMLAEYDAALDLARDLFLEPCPYPEDEPLALCSWCEAAVPEAGEFGFDADDHDLWIDLAMNEYWGPLQFHEPEPSDDEWRVALLLGGQWRWMALYRPTVPEAPYTMGARVCSATCRTRLLTALRAETAERRPQ